MRRLLRTYPSARPTHSVIIQKITETGEYRVAYREKATGKTEEESAYYTDVWGDAEQTAQLMIEHRPAAWINPTTCE